MDQLVDGGHLAVEVSHGRGSSNRYRIIIKDIAAQNEPDDEEQPDDDEDPPKTAKSSASETLFPDDLPPAKAKVERMSAIDEAFENFWRQYPKRVGKAAARKIYQRIISKGEATPQELLAGVMRYSARTAGKDVKYIKYLQGWLNDARWTDEADPAPSVQFGAPSRSQQPRRRTSISP